MSDLRADTVIVGGGTAGCVLARRLAERGERVVVLEAGGGYSRLLHGPPLGSQTLRAAFSYRYETTPQRGLGGRRLAIPLGRVLGGSSTTNAMMYCRGRASDYDRWATKGAQGWSYAEVLPYFDRLERRESDGPPAAGDGRFDVARPRFRAPFSEAFVEACGEAGVAAIAEQNGATQEGCGYFDVAQRRGERTSAAGAYLPRRRERGFVVLTGARVTELLVNGSRAEGVRFVRRGRERRALAERCVVLAAGAAHTPQILMLAGIGPAEHLRAQGIEPLVDLPGVGANLQDHVRIPVLYETPTPSPGRRSRWVSAVWDYALRRDGVMCSNCCEAGAFVRSSDALAEPDLQFVTHFQNGMRGGVVDLQFCLMSARSRGTVRLRSASYLDAPLIDPNFLDDPGDVEACLSGVAQARALAGTGAMGRFPLGDEWMPGRGVRARGQLAAYLRRTAEPCYHLAGTCRMGVDEDAVVDPQLRVRGMERLRVADASVFPDLIHGNTMAPAVMVGEKAADLISAG